jgi:glycosyltransferase involved in cell wall biosynthesis
MVVQQAMAAGLAVVASDVGGIPFQVQHDVNGLLFPAGDTSRLAALIARLEGEQRLSERLGRAARAHAEAHWRAAAVASATIDVYRNMRSTWKAKATVQ